MPCDVITDMRVTSLSSTEHALVITGTNLAETSGGVYALVDDDNDGFVDTVETLIDAGLTHPNAIHATARAGGGGASAGTVWYVLNSAAGEVRNLGDDDADGLPDAVGAAFATTATTPAVSDAMSLMSVPVLDAAGVPTGDETLALSSVGALYESEAGWDDWWVTLADTTGDGVADTVSAPLTYGANVEAAPSPIAGARDDDEFVLIGGVPGHTVRVLGWNGSSGAHDILLGTDVVGPERSVCVPVLPSFDKNQTYVLTDDDTGATSVAFTPGKKNSTQISGISPTFGDSSGGQAIAIHGFGLPSNPTVLIGGVAATVIDSSDTQILAVTPDLGTDLGLQVDVVVLKGSSEHVAHLMFHTGL